MTSYLVFHHLCTYYVCDMELSLSSFLRKLVFVVLFQFFEILYSLSYLTLIVLTDRHYYHIFQMQNLRFREVSDLSPK